MKIVQITPGTGNWVCGSCLRDLTVVRELRALGADAIAVPLYLPLCTEGGLAADAPIFFGGINVFLQQKLALFRRTPRWLDRLWDRPGLLRLLSRGGQMTNPRELGRMTLSMLRGEDGNQVKELERLGAWLDAEVRPDLVVLSNGLLIGMAGYLKRRLGCGLVCSLQGEDGFLDSLAEPYRTEAWEELRKRAAAVDLLIGVSRYYAERMHERLRLPAAGVAAVPNGVTVEDIPVRETWPDPPVVGFLARICREKGVAHLAEAFRLLRREPGMERVRLRLVGALTGPDERLARALRGELDAAGLGDALQLHPNVDREEKLRLLLGMTVLSVPAQYGEAFGLYVLEALAAGVPVVQPAIGAFPELIETTGGGLLVEPGDAQGLARALAELIRDRERNEALARAGREAVLERFTSRAMAERLLAHYRRLVDERKAANVKSKMEAHESPIADREPRIAEP